MDDKKFNTLTEKEKLVIVDKQTEAPFSGEYDSFFGSGIYVCRRCNAKLYRSETKFRSGCGWPSFDQEIEGAVKKVPNGYSDWMEIRCNNCDGHLGHVFVGEGFTEKNTRHCVNSVSLKFIPIKS